MELNPTQQAYRLVEKSRNILVIAPPYSNSEGAESQLDKITASLSMLRFLEKNQQKASLVIPGFNLADFPYLPDSTKIKKTLNTKRDLIISLEINQAEPVKKVTHKQSGSQLEIIITPKNKTIKKPSITTKAGRAAFDLIIGIGLTDLEILGKTFENNSETFYELPIINIDYRPTNEYFGEVNLVEVTASSNSEVMFEFLNKINSNFLDETISTYLLGGIMAATKSFRLPSTTPKTFSIAAELSALGANKELVVENIYKKRNFGLLKLWGRALARLKEDTERKMLWTILTKDDFAKSETSHQEVAKVFTELKDMMPGADFIVLITEEESGTNTVYLSISKNYNPEVLLGKDLNISEIANRYELTLDLEQPDLLSAEEEIISKLSGAENNNDLTVS